MRYCEKYTYLSNVILSRYKQHKTDFEVVPSERPLALPCQVRGCSCLAYYYVPQIGPNPVRCRCKHLPQDHSEASGYLCKKCKSKITTFKDISLKCNPAIYTINDQDKAAFLYHVPCQSGSSCSGFQSPYTCGCGQPSSAHKTLVNSQTNARQRYKTLSTDIKYILLTHIYSSMLLTG